MVSLRLSSSRSSSNSSCSLHESFQDAASSPVGSTLNSSASSSRASLPDDDQENITITPGRRLPPQPKNGKHKSQEDLRFLAISTHMTEMSYSISDIQTRIFEIQELRHKSQSSGDTAGTTSIIDQSLMSLNERLESVAQGMKSMLETLTPILDSSKSGFAADSLDPAEKAIIIRKHATLVAEWEAVQDESEVLREELKEDKWLTVFRTVTDQADGMMTSLEKAINRCQDFIWQVHRRGPDDMLSVASSGRADQIPLNLETFTSLMESFEAKKKHYMPATSKVLSIIDKGVQDRVTKNGETLRRHADSAQRWKNLRERITRTEAEMEAVRKILLSADANVSETGSSTSGLTQSSTRHGFLNTPPTASRSSESRAGSISSTMSRSISPFRKLARKLTRSKNALVTPEAKGKTASRSPSSEPTMRIRPQRSSMFPLHGSPMQATPDRPAHKYSQSFASGSPSSSKNVGGGTAVSSQVPKQRWNSSTRVEADELPGTVRGTTPSGRPSISAMDHYPDPASSNPYKRSVSRSSMASSRPWTPVNSSASTAPSNLSISARRPSSRAARPPPRAQTPSSALPRSRPQTPSQIPAPSARFWSQFEGEWDEEEGPTTLMQRAFTPDFSMSQSSSSSPRTPRSPKNSPLRPPSRSMIPVPSLQFSSASRPSSAMSSYSGKQSPFRISAMRAQTPESALRARVQQLPFYHPGRAAARPTLPGKLPPSSFKDSSTPRTTLSRPASRAGAATPGFGDPVHEYVPSNPRDPLDAEVAAIVNSIAHGLLIERVDPPLRTIPKEGEEIRAQYAFSNSLARKIVTCKLTTLTRVARGTTNAIAQKKVMCRVGGGWMDLQLYMLNRQAGL